MIPALQSIIPIRHVLSDTPPLRKLYVTTTTQPTTFYGCVLLEHIPADIPFHEILGSTKEPTLKLEHLKLRDKPHFLWLLFSLETSTSATADNMLQGDLIPYIKVSSDLRYLLATADNISPLHVVYEQSVYYRDIMENVKELYTMARDRKTPRS